MGKSDWIVPQWDIFGPKNAKFQKVHKIFSLDFSKFLCDGVNGEGRKSDPFFFGATLIMSKEPLCEHFWVQFGIFHNFFFIALIFQDVLLWKPDDHCYLVLVLMFVFLETFHKCWSVKFSLSVKKTLCGKTSLKI